MLICFKFSSSPLASLSLELKSSTQTISLRCFLHIFSHSSFDSSIRLLAEPKHTLSSRRRNKKKKARKLYIFFSLFSASLAPKKEEKTLLDPRNNVMLSSTRNCRFGICVGHGAAAHTTHSEPSKKRRNNFFSIVTYSSHKFNSREHKKEIEMCYRRERKICVSDEKRHGVWD